MSWVEKNRKINNPGGGGGGETIIRDSKEAGRCPEYGFRPQMSIQMQVGHAYSLSRFDMPIHCHASPAKRFPPKTVNE